jgi:HIV-1 Vpr-binding protein
MERVCTLPPSVVQEIVAVALFLLGCAQDPARRNAALFFGGSFVFRAILDAFDSQDGLRKVLMLLRNAAALRSGGGSGTSSAVAASAGSRSDRSLAAEVLTSSGKQIAYHTCVALRQYFRAHLLLLVDSLRPYRGHRGGSRSGISGRAIYKPLDLSNEAMETIILQLQRDRKLGPAFVRARWAPLEKFMSYGGHTILIELAQAAPGERYLHEIAQHALGVLQIVSLVPYTRRLVVGSTLSNDRSGMAVFLDSASGAAFCDPEVSVSSPVSFFYDFLLPDPFFGVEILNLLFGLDSLSLFTWAPSCTLMEVG